MNKYSKIFSLTLFTLLAVTCKAQNDASGWNETLEKKHLQNRQDSTTWDLELLKRDLNDRKENGIEKPMAHGPFPVPKYDLLGNYRYRGGGVGGRWKNYEGKKIVYNYFVANKTEISQEFLGNKKNEVFYTIISLTDFVDTVNFTHARSHFTSRNNPDFTCEGYYKTKENEVDYLAFLTANREQYAIVNMRLFNLKHGRVILIAPQKDGSLRSLQLSSPLLSADEMEAYIDKILKQEKVKEFFTNKANI